MGHEMDTILIIEDNWTARELFSIQLALEKYFVVATGEFEIIREKIRASKPDIVLLDLFMKGKLRWDVLTDIIDENPELPVMIINLFDNYGDDPHLLLVDGCVIKRYRMDDIKQKIGEVLRRKHDSHVTGNLHVRPEACGIREAGRGSLPAARSERTVITTGGSASTKGLGSPSFGGFAS